MYITILRYWHELVNRLCTVLHRLMPDPSSLIPTEDMLIQQKIDELESQTSQLPEKIHVLDWEIEFLDVYTLIAGLRYQVLLKINDFIANNEFPLILDCGANIGISVLRFKQLYPNAQIVAFEPDPEICDVLRRNVHANQLENVTIIEAAVWKTETALDFFSDGRDGGFVLKEQCLPMRNGKVTHVNAVRLADYLTTSVDFVKLDIEGAELTVLQDCAHLLHNVGQMIVEVHYHVNEPGILADILTILERASFRVSLIVPFANGDPRIDLRTPYFQDPNRNADLYPVIYAWR